MEFDIGGSVLEATPLEIRVENNVNGGVDLTGRIADPNNTPTADIGGTSDNIHIFCPTSGPVFCGTIVGEDQFSFYPTLQFSNDDTLLSSNDLPVDPAIWNAFSFREMSLFITDGTEVGEAYIGAYIGPVTLVPEPSTAFLLFGPLALYVCALARPATAVVATPPFLPRRCSWPL